MILFRFLQLKEVLQLRNYLNEKGVHTKSIIKVNEKNKHIIVLLIDGDEKIINVEDASDIMVIRNYV